LHIYIRNPTVGKALASASSDYIKDDKVSFVVGIASFSGFPMLCADALIYLAS